MVGLSGLELLTSRLSGVRSNQLSYRPIMVETRRIELLTPCLQGRCSSQLSYTPVPYSLSVNSSFRSAVLYITNAPLIGALFSIKNLIEENKSTFRSCID